MKKSFLFLLFALLVNAEVSAQIVRQKTVDNGGSGMFKAIAVKDANLPDFVIYRPKDLMHAHARCGALPLLLFGNGGCSDTSLGYEKMLTEVASHGYIVIAIGEFMQQWGERNEGHSESSELKRGLDWICQETQRKGSDYYDNIDLNHIAAAGHSCGGAQVLANAADERISTCLILNAGMGDMEMAGASRESLKTLHTPMLYITGGPSDVAYNNAQLDYERIDRVPVVLADHPASGHGGTYGQPNGGDYARMVIDWLDWQLKGKKENADIFINANLKNYQGWTVKAKNFHNTPGRIDQAVMPCKLLKGISEREYSIYLPGNYDENIDKTYPVLYLMHGGGGSNTDWQRFFNLRQTVDSLIDAKIIDDMVIVCPEGNKVNMMYFNAPDWNYEDYFFQELIPFIQNNYRVKTDKAGRAIAGFSMGGGAAVVYGVHHPDMFTFVGDIAGYLRRQPLEFLKNDPMGEWRQTAVEENNPIIRVQNGNERDIKEWKTVNWFITVGDHDFTLEANMDFVKQLRAKQINYNMNVAEGQHDGKYVYPALIDIIKRADRFFH